MHQLCPKSFLNSTLKKQREIVNIADQEGGTALHYVVYNGAKKCKLLLSKGAEVNLKDNIRIYKTALYYAKIKGIKI